MKNPLSWLEEAKGMLQLQDKDIGSRKGVILMIEGPMKREFVITKIKAPTCQPNQNPNPPTSNPYQTCFQPWPKGLICNIQKKL
jgi:hypothetical protein